MKLTLSLTRPSFLLPRYQELTFESNGGLFFLPMSSQVLSDIWLVCDGRTSPSFSHGASQLNGQAAEYECDSGRQFRARVQISALPLAAHSALHLSR